MITWSTAGKPILLLLTSVLLAIVLTPVLAAAQASPASAQASPTPAQSGPATTQNAATPAQSQPLPTAAQASSESAAATQDQTDEHVLEDESVVHADELRWEHLFSLVIEWSHSAARLKSEGGMAAVSKAMEERLQKQAGLTEDQAKQVLAVSQQWRLNLDNSARERVAVVAKVRDAHPGQHMDRTNSPEIRAVIAKRWKLTRNAMGVLQNLLGDEYYSKLEKYSYEASRYAINPERR